MYTNLLNRLSIARAVYSDKDIFLLDDCLTTLTLEVTFDFLLELEPQPVNMSNELNMTELMIVSFFIAFTNSCN